MKVSTAVTLMALGLGGIMTTAVFPVVWSTRAQQPPVTSVTGQPGMITPDAPPQPDPDAQNLADAMQGVVSANALLRNAIFGYDRKVSATFADQRAQLAWWKACADDDKCWAWLAKAKPEAKP